MLYPITRWIGLSVLCLLLLGCGEEQADSTPSATPEKPKQGPVEAEIVVEASEPKLILKGESIDTMQWVESILDESDASVLLIYHAQIDRDFNREGQRLIWITPNLPDKADQAGIDQAAGEIFALLKTAFDARAKQALSDELAYQQAGASAAAQEVKQLQQTLQSFQEERRGLPQTDASRLERRKLDRQIENALQAQIEASNRVESLQKQIDRKRYPTLLRVR